MHACAQEQDSLRVSLSSTALLRVVLASVGRALKYKES